MDRIRKLCSYLKPCSTFADIGCDHGYCTNYMLENSLCEKAVVSDISEQCLEKAERLLQKFIKAGKCIPVCCNGLEKIDPNTELVLIAGMGGEEIVSILNSAFIPENFVLQPMKNIRAVREFLIEKNAEISCDDVFSSNGKFYFVICGKKRGNKSIYNAGQLEYGKGDIRGELGAYLRCEIAKKRSYLKRNLSEESRVSVLNKIKFMEKVMSGETE